jgi:uncharacterized protein (DUF58 family)
MNTGAAGRAILLPTATGIGWTLAALVILSVAINYGNNLLFALAFLLLSVWVTAGWECLRNLAGLEWTPAPAPSAFAGEMLCLAGRVHDPLGRRARAPLMLCAGTGRRRTRGLAAAWDGGATLELALPAPARGRRRIEGLYLVSPHPLGLWQARRPLPGMAALVYPRPEGARPLPAAAPVPAHWRREAGDFQGLRAYTPGDAPRRIDWRVYARRGELAVKDFDGGAGGHALWLDIGVCEGDVEARLSQLCQWVCAAERQGHEYGLRLGGGQDRTPGLGRAHRRDCLTRLALHGL